MKAGLAGEETPNLVFPTIMGRPKHKKVLPSSIESNTYVGPTEKTRGLLNISYPITHGVITDLQDMKSIWSHIYSELKMHKKEVFCGFWMFEGVWLSTRAINRSFAGQN